MPSKNQKQLNFFLLVKAYTEFGEIGVKHHWKKLKGYKPKLTPDYIDKLAKTARTITSADLIDKTSGIEGSEVLGDNRDLRVGYWALFRGLYKPKHSNDSTPKEGEFIAQIKKVDNKNRIVNFNQNGFRNKFGNLTEIPKRANISHPEFMFLDFALFDNVIRTGKTPKDIAENPSMEESLRLIVKTILIENTNIELVSKSDKGNRLFDMLKTAKFQHYDSPKGQLSPFTKGEEDRKRLVSKLSVADKKKYKEWLNTSEGQESLLRFK